ncbi:BLOC-1-related complex subunit 7-like [Mytilus galloprovincialis]|uniref:BLOC-1-related complex subunit 7 n=1 Tax=Mytilus galloprovincialis TaxID=29158 RepID=A0A8B6CJB0_MYTGA|nr:Hypothetical predicted protein [Mytilus galloprovincialis]
MSSMQWNQETKTKLNEKVTTNILDMASLARQLVRSSRSNELLAQAAKNFSCQEQIIQNSANSLTKMQNITTQLEYQESAVERSMSTIDDIQDQLKTIQR